MKKYTQIKNVVETVFEDCKPHNISEVREKCINQGIDMTTDKNAISNIVFNLKKTGVLRSTGVKGEYEKTPIDVLKEENSNNVEVGNTQVDWNEFFILKPQKRFGRELRVTVVEKGEIRLNSTLKKKISSDEIELILSKNCKVILLSSGKSDGHKFTKAGTVKNQEIVELMRKLKISFPATYIVNWDEGYQMWKGILQVDSQK